MKLISDFDGVWTKPHGEAAAVRGHMVATVAALTKVDEARADAMIAAIDAALDDRPEDYGWTIEGQVSAFADEDPFVRNNARAHFVDRLLDQVGRIRDRAMRHDLLTLREAAIAADGSLPDFANRVFTEATLRHREEAKPRPTAEDCAAVQAFLDAGHDVVIVSNSSTAKIADFLSRSPLAYTEGGLDRQEAGKVRIRGGAMKFMIADDPRDTIELGGRTVRCDRPRYLEILREEQGDAVIGDVVSLDHALPWKLNRDGELDMRLLLVTRDYVPGWSRGLIESAGLIGVEGLTGLGAALGV